jgi:outer membrane receptor protein involved in Fe transport
MRFRIPAFLRFLTIAGVLTASSLQLFAQVGKIEGRVINQQTREPIPGANVLIEESTMGAGADMDGNYFIINVRPGVYNIRTSAIGYQTVVTQEVRVSIDLTTRIDFELPEAVLKLGEEVVVVAERPIIQRDLTATTAVISGDLIQALPVTEFTQVLNLQAGFVDGHLRGGRSGEIAYWIDGMPVTDVYDGGIVVEVGTNSIQEMQLISGAFSAEYGQAMSGVVNIVTRDGTNQFRANVSTYGGDYVTKNDGIFLGHTDPNPWNIRNLEAGLSGPVINDKLFFDTNLRYIYFNGWLYGRRVFNPANITDNRSTNIAEWIPSMNPEIGRGDSSFVSMNPSEKYYAQGKLTFRASPALRLSYNFIYDDVRYRDFDFAFILNPGGDFQRFRTGYTHIANLNHMLSSRTFYTLGFSYFKKDYRHYVYENPKDSLYVHPRLLGQAPPYSAATGGTKMQWFKRNTESYVAKIDVTSQITRSHQIKTGVEFRYHELFFRDITLIPSVADANREPVIDGNPYITTEIPSQESFSHNEFLRNPVELSWYIQDKMEFDDMVVNLGVRFDYFYPDGRILNDITPHGTSTVNDPNIFEPLNPVHAADPLEVREQYWYKNTSPKWQFSPRLGVAFPITDRGKLHFSYGHFFQIPNFDLLYQNPDFKVGTGTGNVGLVGNSDLKPEQTISGEIGLQQEVLRGISVEIAGYFRDIRNLAGTRADEITLFGGSGKYSQYVNSDFGFVRGVIVRIERRFVEGFAATVDYTYQIAKGNASDPAATRNFLLGGIQPEEQLISLDWDQTHTFNTTVTYASRAQWGGSIIMRFGSGLPFTPRQTDNIARLLLNSQRRPQFFNIDMNIYKDFKLGFVQVSLWSRIINLFDIRNQVNVYNDSGRADFTIDEIIARNTNPPELINSIGEYYHNPSFYSEPRRIEIGLTISL